MPHPDCCGSMFPDPDQRADNRWLTGTVFSTYTTCIGLGEQGRETRIDREQYDRCQACPSFTACRDLSFGTMLMHLAFR